MALAVAFPDDPSWITVVGWGLQVKEFDCWRREARHPFRCYIRHNGVRGVRRVPSPKWVLAQSSFMLAFRLPLWILNGSLRGKTRKYGQFHEPASMSMWVWTGAASMRPFCPRIPGYRSIHVGPVHQRTQPHPAAGNSQRRLWL